MAAADLESSKRDRRPSLVDLRNVLSLDDFDAFCAQASSGGSIYGMLRKQIYMSQDVAKYARFGEKYARSRGGKYARSAERNVGGRKR